MTPSGAWKTLSPGRGPAEGLALAVDFDVTGRPEARFSDLVANLATPLTVWESVPPAAGVATSGKDYVDHWVAALEVDRPPIRAILGFCAGSVYAAALAERVTGWQDDAPRLVILDPELSTGQTLLWQFTKVMGFMTSMLTPEQIAQARQAGDELYATTPEPGPLKDALIQLMRENGEPALIAIGLDEARRAELFGVFESFLGYLAAAAEIDPLDTWRAATAFSSRSPLAGLNAMRAAGYGDEVAVGAELAVDVDHATMLADPGLASAVSELLQQ